MSKPAFPTPVTATGFSIQKSPETGMTLREYFAAKAMAAHIMRHPIESGGTDYDFDETISRWSYAIADAMLKAREA